MLNVQNADVYTDFNGLAKLKNEAKAKTPEAILEVAKQFESIFVGMMLKSMRQVKLAEGILDNNQSEFYRDMYDQQLSIHLSGKGGIGIADSIVKQLSPDQSTVVVRNQKIGDYERQLLIRKPAESQLDGMVAELKDAASKAIDSISKHKDVKMQLKTGSESGQLGQVNRRINSAEDFVNHLRPYAEKAANELGVDANILLAQAALESGWGKSVIKTSDGSSSYNLFNIKADKSWQGQQQKAETLEYKDGVARKEMAGFRAYSSYQESFDDYVNFIKTNPRYKTAIKMAEQPERYMHELQQAGYATDPNYADKVMKIYQSKAIANQILDLLAMKQPLPQMIHKEK
jgi:flagellar protein FlgJ